MPGVVMRRPFRYAGARHAVGARVSMPARVAALLSKLKIAALETVAAPEPEPLGRVYRPASALAEVRAEPGDRKASAAVAAVAKRAAARGRDTEDR